MGPAAHLIHAFLVVISRAHVQVHLLGIGTQVILNILGLLLSLLFLQLRLELSFLVHTQLEALPKITLNRLRLIGLK